MEIVGESFNVLFNIYRLFCWSVKLRNVLIYGDIKWLWGLYMELVRGKWVYNNLYFVEK